MAQTVEVEVREATTRYVTLKERAWLNGEGVPVPDGDPGAATLIGPAGKEFTWEEAVAFGLVADSPGPKRTRRRRSRATKGANE